MLENSSSLEKKPKFRIGPEKKRAHKNQISILIYTRRFLI
jgi:hypothetical protein